MDQCRCGLGRPRRRGENARKDCSAVFEYRQLARFNVVKIGRDVVCAGLPDINLGGIGIHSNASRYSGVIVKGARLFGDQGLIRDRIGVEKCTGVITSGAGGADVTGVTLGSSRAHVARGAHVASRSSGAHVTSVTLGSSRAHVARRTHGTDVASRTHGTDVTCGAHGTDVARVTLGSSRAHVTRVTLGSSGPHRTDFARGAGVTTVSSVARVTGVVVAVAAAAVAAVFSVTSVTSVATIATVDTIDPVTSVNAVAARLVARMRGTTRISSISIVRF